MPHSHVIARAVWLSICNPNITDAETESQIKMGTESD